MPTEPIDSCEAELLLLIEPDREPGLDGRTLNGVAPLIGVMLPELLGVVMPALEALPPLGLLLRGMNSPLETLELDEPSGLEAASSSGVGAEAFWFFERPLRMPVLESALPPAYTGRLPQQLHPVKNRPRLHAPMRPARGILPIVLSSPV